MNVLIIEDHPIVAFTLSRIVRQRIANAEIILAELFLEGLSLMKQGMDVGLVILDVNLPDTELHHMVAALRDIQQNVPILVFTGNEQHTTALGFLNAGVNGYLTKNQPIREVGIAIQAVLSGQRYITPDVKKIFGTEFFAFLGLNHAPLKIELSPREKEVLAMLLDGKATKQISLDLNLKLTTVSAHKTRIFDKFQVNNIIELYKKIKLN
ncbi:two component transcriptional regulator, LuxR family [Dyadobacter koreensis]|uniref:Two component transcriptional regulator, LuxR family n=1 Tax=Dyadobacter koreensis TaxID=408657 RepID=A0A1H7B6G5_9BACT|nr:response regulator transcription factor [Dyadobacter koreensis]SEJ69005.1 two component transcriptional regulator, LuxR family [Dyadobacter koreensis]